MRTRLAVLMLLAACGSSSGGGDDDQVSIDAPVVPSPDATPACGTLPFGTPAEVGGVPPNVHGAWLTADQLAIYYSSDVSGGGDLFFGTRTSTSAAFSGSPLTVLNDATGGDEYPSLTPDGETIYFDSNRVSAGNYDIYWAQRTSPLDPFFAPALVDNVNTGNDDGQSAITSDGLTLYFTSSRSGNFELYRTTAGSGGAFGTPQLVGELNTAANESNPVLTANGLQIFFARGGDIYSARRATTVDGFGAASAITEIDTTGRDDPEWVSGDGCTLYFASDFETAGVLKLYVARRGG